MEDIHVATIAGGLHDSSPEAQSPESGNTSAFPLIMTHSLDDVLLPTPSNISDVRAFLPSKQPTVKRHSLTGEETEYSRASLRKRKGDSIKQHASLTAVKSQYPPGYNDDVDAKEMNYKEYSQAMDQVRSLTSSLSVKREARNKVYGCKPTAKKKSKDVINLGKSKNVQKLNKRYREVAVDWEVWKGAFKEIEGQFGSAVVSYFRFLKWLFWLNLFLAIMLLCVIMLPQELMDHRSFENNVQSQWPNGTVENKNIDLAMNYSQQYDVKMKEYSQQNLSAVVVLDFLQGTGWMESSVLFYGYYFNHTYTVNSRTNNYNMPLAYLTAILAYFIVSLIAMVRYSAHGVRNSMILEGDTFNQTCNKVFCGWDYNLTNPRGANLNMKRLTNEFRDDLKHQHDLRKRHEQKCRQRTVRYFIRFIVNIVVVAILAASAYLIVFASEQVKQLSETRHRGNSSQSDSTSDTVQQGLALLINLLPSITITVLNIICPMLFQWLVILERYMPETELKITIFRTVLLKLASVVVLIITLRGQVDGCTKISSADVVDVEFTCNANEFICCCWETYVGQQFYKLVLVDFIVVCVSTFLVETPRRLIVQIFGSDYKIAKMIGQQEFQIPKNVLDLVYSQTICWMGAVFSPLIPAITVTKFLIYFYVKKFTLMSNCVPSSRPYRASRSNSFFMIVLLVSFVLCGLPVVYTLTKVTPSRSCGPFRIHSRSEDYVMWTALTDALSLAPAWFKEVLIRLSSWVFYIPAAIILCLLIYYFYAIASGYRRLIEQQKLQLASEGKDKQFLLQQIQTAFNNNKR